MSYKFNPFTGNFDNIGELSTSVMEFKGVFDPATATFTDATGDAGDVYQATAAGSYDAGSGSITYAIGDWAVHNGSVFQKSLNSIGANTNLSNLTNTIQIPDGVDLLPLNDLEVNVGSSTNRINEINSRYFSSILTSGLSTGFWGANIPAIVINGDDADSAASSGSGILFKKTTNGGDYFIIGTQDNNAVGNTVGIFQATGNNTTGGTGSLEFFTGLAQLNSGAFYLQSGNSTAGDSGQIQINTGIVLSGTGSSGVINLQTGAQSGTGNSGAVQLSTGNATFGQSGNIWLDIGIGATQGTFRFLKSGVSNNIGAVWLATNTNGEGYWSNNLVDTSSVNSLNHDSRILYDSSGDESIRYNDRLMYDNTNNASLDYDARSLRDPAGNVAMSWNSSQYITFYPNGGVPRILEFWDGNFSNTVNITAPTNVTLDYTLTLPQTASGSANSVVLEDGSGTLSFSTNLKDTTGVQSVLYSSRELTDSTGSEVALNWDTRILSDINSDPAINFSSATDIVASKNIDFDANGTLNIGSSTNNANVLWTRNVESNSYLGLYADLNHVELGSNAEEVKIITWNGVVAPTLKLQDSNNFDVGIKSPDVLSASYTLTLPADDGTPSQVMSTDGSGTLSFIGTLADASNVQSVLFQTRELTDSTGTEVALNWDTRVLSDTGSIPAIDFSDATDVRILGHGLRIPNNTYLKARNQLDDADINVLKIDTSNGLLVRSGNYIDIDAGAFSAGLYGSSVSVVATADLDVQAANSSTIAITDTNAELFLSVDIISFSGQNSRSKTRWYNTAGTNYIEMQAPGGAFTNATYTLPADGTSGQVLSTNGTGTLSFVTRADTTLSNLAGTVAIPNSVHILPANDKQVDIGSGSVRFGSGFFGTQIRTPSINIYDGASSTTVIGRLDGGAGTSPSGANANIFFYSNNNSATQSQNSIVIMTDNQNTNASGYLLLETGNNTGANATVTGNIKLKTGNKTAGTGNSGSVTIETGTSAGGTRGSITLDALTANLTVNKITVPTTVTTGGTTGNQTINKVSGTVNFAAAATSLVVTNSEVSANSIVLCTIRTNDATMTSVQAVPAAGSFTLYANAAATAETSVGFLVING